MSISIPYIHYVLDQYKENQSNDEKIIREIRDFTKKINHTSDLNGQEFFEYILILVNFDEKSCSKPFQKILNELKQYCADIYTWQTIQLLHQFNCLDKNIFPLLTRCNSNELMAEVINALAQKGLLNKANLKLIDQHPNSYELICSLYCLKRDGILSYENFVAVVTHAQPKNLAIALWDLENDKILTTENRNALAQSRQPIHAAKIFRKLHQKGLLEKNRDYISGHPDQQALASIYLWLAKYDLLNQENINAIIKHKNIEMVAKSLAKLKVGSQIIFNLILRHPYPEEASAAIQIIHHLHYLAPESLENIDKREHPLSFAKGVEYLVENNIYTKNNMTALLESKVPDSVAPCIKKLITLNIYSTETLILICQSEKPTETLDKLKVKLSELVTENNKKAEEFLKTLENLEYMSKLTTDRFKYIIQSKNPGDIFQQEPELQTSYSENGDGEVNDKSASHFISILRSLSHSKILSIRNYNRALTLINGDIFAIAEICKKLEKAKMLTQITFDAIIENTAFANTIDLFSNAGVLNQETIEAELAKHPISLQYKQKLDAYFLVRLLLDVSPEEKKRTADLFQIAKEKDYLSKQFVSFYASNNDKIPEHIINDLYKYKEYGNDLFAAVLDKLEKYPDKLFFKILNLGYSNPDFLELLAKRFGTLSSIQFFDGGISSDTWYESTMEILRRTPAPMKRDLTKLEEELTGANKSEPKVSLLLKSKIANEGWKFLRTQGRTILFEDQNKNIFAFKIQKEHEPQSDLFKEFHTTSYLNKHANELNLKSKLPIPKSINQISDVLEFLKDQIDDNSLKQFIDLVGKKDVYNGYVYQVNQDNHKYFTYLHDATFSDDEFAQANSTVVNDLCQLLKAGIVYPQLADIFHNKENPTERRDRGRYIILANLLSPWVLATHRKPAGNGRTSNWPGAVEFPNARDGLADYGDWITTNDFQYGSQWIQDFFAPAEKVYGNKVPNYLLANELAEYQYILLLIAGRRGCALTEKGKSENKSASEISAIWQKLANQVLTNCVQMVTSLSNISEEEAREYFAPLINVKRLARQMQFWMTGEYIPYLEKNEIPADIYGDETEVTIDIENFRANTFNCKAGCAIDHVHPDLGPVNSQEPIKEANKLFYWMNNLILSSYHNRKLVHEDLTKIIKEKDPNKLEKMRPHAFAHLPAKQYYSGQLFIFDEMKKRKISPWQLATIEQARKKCRTEYAAATIQTMWKKHKRTRSEQIDLPTKVRKISVV